MISLTFCNGWTDVQRFDEWSVRLSDQQVAVWPDVFAGETVPIAIEAREIRERAFHSDADLRDAFGAAPITLVKGVTVGHPA